MVWLVLGPNWVDAAPLMRVLAVWGLLRSFGNPLGSLLFGLGHVKLSTKWNAGFLLIVPFVVCLGSQWGAIGMAWAMAGLMAVLFIPAWAILIRPTCGAGFWEYSQQVLRPLICSLLAGLIAFLVASNFSHDWLRLIVGLITGAVVYAMLSWIFNRTAVKIAVRFVKEQTPTTKIDKQSI
jgi:O-antigen/teichoic acid export membrane protein